MCYAVIAKLKRLHPYNAMENLEFNLEETFNDVKERALAEGAYSREEWDDLVGEVLDEKKEFNELSDDNDWIEIAEALKARYEDFETEIPEA